MQMAVAELGAAGRDQAGDRRRAAGRALAASRPRSRSATSRRAAMRVQATCRAAATNTAWAASPAATSPRRKRSASASSRPAERRASAERACARGLRQAAVVDPLEDARERHAPALVARPGRGIERRATASPWRSRGRASPAAGPQRLVLGCHQGRDHAQEAFELVARRQCRSRSARAAKTVARSGRRTGSLSATRPACFAEPAVGSSGRCSGLADFLAEPLAMVLPAPAAGHRAAGHGAQACP